MKRDLLIALILGLVSLWFNLYQVPKTAFNPDEGRWIHRAHYLAAIFDPFGPTWDDQYMTRGQPPLGSYVTGLGLLLQGRDLVTNGPWDFTQTAETNAEVGNMPTYDDLMTARRTNAAIVALTVVACYVLGARLTNPVGGAVGALVLAVHPFSSYIGSIATSDALLGLLLALTTLAAIRLVERPTWQRAIAVGILLGLGGATKLSPLFVALPLVLLGAMLVAIESSDEANTRLGWQLFSVPWTAVVTFVVVYPYLWLDPIGRTQNLFAFRVEEMLAQATDWPVMAVPTRAEALRRVGENFDLRYSIAGRLEMAVGDATGLSLLLPRLELPLALLGVLILIALAIKGRLTSRAVIATIVLGGQVGVTIVGMRSEFDRYHVPMAIAGAICIGILAGTLVPLIKGWFAAWHGNRAPAVAAQPSLASGRLALDPVAAERQRQQTFGHR